MRVAVGMSGGVDSSTAALLLKNQGFDVLGVSLLLFETRGRTGPKSCCSIETVRDAAETARILGIGHKVVDARDLFIEKVINPFVDAYSRGLTPNPCILCNRHIKFPILLREADIWGAEFIATGHYARIAREDGRSLLMRGIDRKKDQSYVLYAQTEEELQRLILPLGGYKKEDVRRMAREAGLPVFNRPESQEICFVEGGDYLPFVSLLAPEAAEPGPVIDEAGNVLGTHRGIYAYTIGQRKGLGVPSLKPLYVNRIDPAGNAVHVGPRELAEKREVRVTELVWHIPCKNPFGALVKFRSMMAPVPAMVTPESGMVKIEFDQPQWAPAPGQSAVFYDAETVVGGGIITSAS